MVAENQEKSFISAVYRIVEQTLNKYLQVLSHRFCAFHQLYIFYISIITTEIIIHLLVLPAIPVIA